ncbi:MAG: NAD(P)H-hydrate dehydratase [Firmicutes bacterium]|nr:NAD(P)H-hydrate dehydratase [Bacillota bacterium]
MPILTGPEMRAAEEAVFKELGLSPLLLMENAGAKIVEVLQREFGPLEGKKIHILAGPGNNGGDGLVAARHLLLKGARPKVYLVGDFQKSTPENRTNLNLLRQLSLDLFTVGSRQASKLKFSLNLADLIVDALVGTGFSGKLRKDLESLVGLINAIQRPVVSVDVPTGVDASTGAVGNTAVRADCTVNLGALKVGCLLYPGQAYAGENHLVDLGVPLRLGPKINRFLLGAESLSWLPKREPWGHKGTFGHVLVVAGSLNMAGAAALCGQAVLRGGAGLVTVAVPRSAARRFPPDELMVIPLPETEQGVLSSQSKPYLQELLEKKDVLVLGPGLSRQGEVISVGQEVLRSWQGPAVIDADGLGALTGEFLNSVSFQQRKKWVLTPHPGEMGALLGMLPFSVNENRLGIGKKFAAEWGVNLVLKGAPTLVFGKEKTYINSTGNHGLATGGTGDILAGLIGALLAQGMEPIKAAAAGVYIHGLAADLAAGQGKRGLIASDCLPKIREILS